MLLNLEVFQKMPVSLVHAAHIQWFPKNVALLIMLEKKQLCTRYGLDAKAPSLTESPTLYRKLLKLYIPIRDRSK